ncbi:FAD:protein FMN transferase [Paenibacillus piri]|uniref:FAD:protein FMN transferase n=1 Tax=Paenibacillus piri TaxID=2547395 RepID=A0A4R5KG95_9BACL|nr:FAD:protein FMN transferase [Paenibacillus piri]TDF94439.1 FAD:protein FMN transferase [Paenibacillus piri]
MKKTKLFMDTAVDIQVVTRKSDDAAEAAIQRAFEAFRKVEHACSRFSSDSELMEACRRVKTVVPLSPFLFEPLKFAWEVAQWTNGRFDPAIGKIMEDHGFNRHYLTGETIQSHSADAVTYRDIVLNEQDRTLYLRRPLVIDLGAVAKGFAIDLAARELTQFEGFVVNAGGDLYAGGADESGGKWKIGIQHPVYKDQIIQEIELSNEAVCTSGSYERRSPVKPGVHHMIDPATGQSPDAWVSCSVVAPYAMIADAFSTASFLCGVERGRTLIEQLGFKGILITSGLNIYRIGEI